VQEVSNRFSSCRSVGRAAGTSNGGIAGLGDSFENRQKVAKLAPLNERLAGDAAPAGSVLVVES